jgi:hypothetical protein
MKRILIAGLIVMSGAAVAERAARVFVAKPLDVAAPDGRISATPKGFVVLERGKSGDRVVHHDRDGKEIAELAKVEGKIDRWWVSPDGEAAVVLHDVNVLTLHGAAGDFSEPEHLLAGDVAFSPDGKRLAFRTGDKVVARDAARKGWRVEIPGSGVLEGPLWSGDGKSLVVVTGDSSVAGGVLKSSPDTVEWCDPRAEKPEWKKVFKSDGGTVACLASDLTGRRVAFIETKGGWKLRLYDLDKGELDVLDESGGWRSLAFTPAGDLLATAETRAGRIEAGLIGTVRGGTKRGVSRDRVGDLPDADIHGAAAGASDFWFVTHTSGVEELKVVRVTPK